MACMLKREINLLCVVGALCGLFVSVVVPVVVPVASAESKPKPSGTKPTVPAHAHPPSAAAGDTNEKTGGVEPAAAEVARRAEVVARFDGGTLTIGDLENEIESQSPMMRERYVAMDARKALLDKTVRFELLAREAVRRGYDKNDTVAFAVKQNAVQTMIRQEFDEKNTAEMVPAEDVKKYYDAHIDEFVRPELRRASQVLVATEADATRLLPETKSADMRTFRELARNKSLDQESKLRGGDLRYFDAKGRVFDETAAAVDPVLAATTFALKDVGDTSEPLKVERGYAILKLTGQRAAHEETLADASETIRSRLWRERRQAGIDALLDWLRAQYKPEIHPELVDAIRFDSSAALPSTTKPVAKPAAAAH